MKKSNLTCVHCDHEHNHVQIDQILKAGNVYDEFSCSNCGGINSVLRTEDMPEDLMADLVRGEAKVTVEVTEMAKDRAEGVIAPVEVKEVEVLEEVDAEDNNTEDDLFHCVIDVDGDGKNDKVTNHKSEASCLKAGGNWIK